jgi:hypothetical protein
MKLRGVLAFLLALLMVGAFAATALAEVGPDDPDRPGEPNDNPGVGGTAFVNCGPANSVIFSVQAKRVDCVLAKQVSKSAWSSGARTVAGFRCVRKALSATVAQGRCAKSQGTLVVRYTYRRLGDPVGGPHTVGSDDDNDNDRDD